MEYFTIFILRLPTFRGDCAGCFSGPLDDGVTDARVPGAGVVFSSWADLACGPSATAASVFGTMLVDPTLPCLCWENRLCCI